MKRLMVCLILLMLPCAALANGWNAPGGTVELFLDSGEYDAYTCIAEDYAKDDAGSVQLVMHSSDHNQLICAEQADGHWVITDTSTKAVYQPGKEKADQVRLSRTENGFMLAYPGETYAFVLENGRWVLESAQVNGLSFIRVAGGLLVMEDAGETVFWQLGTPEEQDAVLTLEEFNISLFPRELWDVQWMLNGQRAIIANGGGLLSIPVETEANKTLPVYSAPSENSWRGADGKAAVSLRDTEGLRTFGALDGWQLIEYKVDLRTSRVGYIQAEGPEINDAFRPISGGILAATYLTDDPDVSQQPRMTFSEWDDAALTILDCYGPFYAYVETKLDGQTIRGFVPLQDIYIDLSTCYTIAKELYGAWRGPEDSVIGAYIAMGWDIQQVFTCYDEQPDGTFMKRDGGTWDLFACDPERFNNGSPYALLLEFEDGRVAYMGVSVDGDVMSLAMEATMDFTHVEPEPRPMEEDVMARMAGTYESHSDGSMIADSFTLRADGVIETHGASSHTGEWFVTRYDPAEAYLWDDPEYTMHISLDNGYQAVLGCAYCWYEDDDGEVALALFLDDNSKCDGYTRNDVGAGIIANVSGRYRLASGDALLMNDLFLDPDGNLGIGSADRMDTVGFWIPSAERESRDLTNVTCHFAADSPIHPGETLRFDCSFTPATDNEPAALTFTSEEGSGVYVRYETPGRD